MTRPLTRTELQRNRVLERLRAHGTTHRGEWLDGGRAIDGGEEITRLAARIDELQQPRFGGHKIVPAGREGAFRVYRLVDVAHLPTAKKLPPRTWSSIVRCFNCHTVWPAGYAGECCGEDRYLVGFRIFPPGVEPDAAVAPVHFEEAA